MTDPVSLVPFDDPQREWLLSVLARFGIYNISRLKTLWDRREALPCLLKGCPECGGTHILDYRPCLPRMRLYTHASECPRTQKPLYMQADPGYLHHEGTQ